MVKIDGITDPERWVAEHNMPPASRHGVDEVLEWVANLDEEAEALTQGAILPDSEGDKVPSRITEKRDLIMHVLRCVFEESDPEQTSYLKVKLQAIKDRRSSEVTEE